MKNLAMRVAAMGIAGVVVALDCAAGTLLVPVGVTTNINVAVDTTLSDAVTLTDRSAIEKTGAGTLTLPGGQFTQNKTVDLRVREGGVALTSSPQALAAYPQPTETMNKAAFWLESRTNLVKEGDDIVAWRDVRDVDPAATNHYYAVVEHSWSDLCPQEATYTDKPVVYFQGYQSGCWMNWQNPAGGQATVGNLYHVFIVHGAARYWGYVLGQRNGQRPYFQPNGVGGTDSAIWIAHNGENRPMHSSRTYRDGIEVDPFTTAQGTGIHVIEVDCLEMRQSAQCFFNDRDYWKDANGYNPMFGETSTKQTEGGKRAGGEYICEMLLFTNRLSEAERVSVSNWLLAKWKDVTPPAAPAAVVTLATNATVSVEGGALAAATVVGDGTLVKTGSGMLVVPALTQPASRTVHVRVDEGPLTLGQPLPVTCSAGDTVTSAITYAGPQLTPPAATAGAGRLVKAGNGPLLLDGVPDGVTNLVVSGGLLTLADPDRKVDLLPGPDRNVAATIPEWNFETYNATSVNNSQKYFNNTEYMGWHGIQPSDGYSQVFIFDNAFGSPPSWGLKLDTPDGRNCLAVKHNASAWCSFTVPETGDYVLSFLAAPRNGSYMGRHLNVMIGPDAANLTALETVIGEFAVSVDKWVYFTFNPIRLEGGTTYQLWFKSLDVGGDKCTLFDAITLKIPEVEVGRWTIPNGDFEFWATNFVNGFSLDNTNRVVGFTVEQGSNFSAGTAHSYSTFSVADTDSWAHYNRPWSTGGKTQLYLTGEGAKLITTFTPPAGKWILQADFSVWCVASGSGTSYSLAATVSAGGETISLGTSTATDHRLVARRWPCAFTSDGATPVTLMLAGTSPDGNYHGILDNLVLVPAHVSAENLLSDPGINSSLPGDWSYVTTPKPSNMTASYFMSWTDSLYKGYFGLSPFEGNACFKLVNDDMLFQPVTFPTGGLYRLTVNLKTRGTTSPNTGNGNNPINVYLAKDGVTNIVGRSDNAATTNFNEYAFTFAVPPAGGTYDVGFRGMSVWSGDESARVDRTTLVDAAWLCRVESERGIDLPEHLKIEVADGARLQLDFAGTNKIDSLRIAGKSYEGLVSVETHPELFPVLAGPGTLMITPKGTLILFR